MVDPPEPSRTYQPTTHNWPRSTMDSIRVSEALDPRSIRGEATNCLFEQTGMDFDAKG